MEQIQVLKYVIHDPIGYVEWKPIDCFDIVKDTYEISNFGDIRRLDNGEDVRITLNQKGYRIASLRTTKNKTIPHFVHRLVAAEFVPNDMNKPIVNHINGYKPNTYYTNLEWSTQQENVDHARITGLSKISTSKSEYSSKTPKEIVNKINMIKPISYNNSTLTRSVMDSITGENNYAAKFTNAQVHEICKLLEQGHNYTEILNIIGMEVTDNNRDMIGNIKRGIAWNHISCTYNIRNIKFSNRVYTDEEIHTMCKLLSEGKSYSEIYETMYNKPYVSSKTDKRFYEFIRKLKNKEHFVNISSQYNL